MTLFNSYLESRPGRRFTRSEWANRFSISRSYISMLASGKKLPSLELAVKIEDMTGGLVTCRSWIDDQQAAMLEPEMENS